MGSHPNRDTASSVRWTSPCLISGVTPWWDTGWAVLCFQGVAFDALEDELGQGRDLLGVVGEHDLLAAY